MCRTSPLIMISYTIYEQHNATIDSNRTKTQLGIIFIVTTDTDQKT